MLAEDGGVVGDDASGGVADGGVVFESDVARDGLDDAEDGVADVGGGGGAVEVFGADLVDEAGLVAGDVLGFDEDFAGAERDGRDGAVFEVDEAGGDEDEGQDEGDHDVVVEAAAFVLPEDVVAEEAHWARSEELAVEVLGRPRDCLVMTVSPPM